MFGKAVASIFLRSVTKERLTDFPKAHTSIMFLPGNQHDQCPTTWSLNAFLRKIKSADVLNARSSVTLSKLRLEAKKNLYKLCFIYSFQKQCVFFLYIPHIVEDVKKKKNPYIFIWRSKAEWTTAHFVYFVYNEYNFIIFCNNEYKIVKPTGCRITVMHNQIWLRWTKITQTFPIRYLFLLWKQLRNLEKSGVGFKKQ